MRPITGTWGPDARHQYVSYQPWNADGTLLVLQNNAKPWEVFLDGNTYLPKFGSCPNDPLYDSRWHPRRDHPHERIGIDRTGLRLIWFDVVRCRETRSTDLPFKASISFSNPSADGRLMVVFEKEGTKMAVVDMAPGPPHPPYEGGGARVGPVFSGDCGLAACLNGGMSISPSGRYVLGEMGDRQGTRDYSRVYDVDRETLAVSPRQMPEGSPECGDGQTAALGYVLDLGHLDLALDPFDGDEDIAVGQYRSWCPAKLDGVAMGSVVKVRLRDNKVTTLTNPDNEAQSFHVSARNLDRPGWIYVSYWPDSGGMRFRDEIIAVRLDGGAVERYTHQHSLSHGPLVDWYRAEPHAVPSRDGRRVLWASNWMLACLPCGTNYEEVKAFVVDTRPSRPPSSNIAPSSRRPDP
jgi:hypothetical protein